MKANIIKNGRTISKIKPADCTRKTLVSLLNHGFEVVTQGNVNITDRVR